VKIATWNVNSIKVRLGAVLAWLHEAEPDVLLLQETKCVDAQFPRLEIEAAGWRCAVHGQPTYNGVAIIARPPIEDVRTGLPYDHSNEDTHARFIEATVSGVRVASIYLPNGNPVGTDKFAYKLAWMERLRQHARDLLRGDLPFVLAGDYNVIPEPVDCYDPAAWANDALFQPESRRALRAMLNLGLTDAYRALHPGAEHAYTFWDYQGGRWQRDQGIRIDHLLLSPSAADRLMACDIDKGPRGKEKASDHTPIWCELADAPPGPRFA